MKPRSDNRMHRAVAAHSALCLIGAATTICYTIFFQRYGFDFTDEGYYIVSIADPFFYSFSVSQFGFIIKPLYEALYANIALIRIANIFATYLLSSALIFSLISGYRTVKPLKALLAACLGASSLTFIYEGLSTPNYNSLALQALLIVALGAHHAQRVVTLASALGWIFIGIGGWLAFMAKPSTAALLTVWALFYILASGKLNARLVLTSMIVSAALLVATATLIEGSPAAFVTRIKTGIDLLNLSGAGYSPDKLFRFDLPALDTFQFLLAFLIVSTSLCAFFAADTSSPSVEYVLLGFSLIVATAVVLVVLGVDLAPHISDPSAKKIFIFAPAAFGVYRFIDWAKRKRPTSRTAIAESGSLLMLPYVYAFGTNNDYWMAASAASFFWIAAAIPLIPASRMLEAGSAKILAVLGLTTQLATVIFLQQYFEHPYRQPGPLWLNSHPVQIGGDNSSLILSDGFATYINEARAKAASAGFSKGTPVVDLTGQSPGLLYALRARNAGFPWLAGGYTGSEDVAYASLRQMPCSAAATAWILIEPAGPRKISDTVLQGIGANLQSDYDLAATWPTASGAGGFAEIRLQEFWKPVRTVQLAELACIEAGKGLDG